MLSRAARSYREKFEEVSKAITALKKGDRDAENEGKFPEDAGETFVFSHKNTTLHVSDVTKQDLLGESPTSAVRHIARARYKRRYKAIREQESRRAARRAALDTVGELQISRGEAQGGQEMGNPEHSESESNEEEEEEYYHKMWSILRRLRSTETGKKRLI